MTKANTGEILDYYSEKYISIKDANSKNLYVLFNELGTNILKNNGMMSYIIPEGFLKTRSYDACVKYMGNYGSITKALYFTNWVFEDATTGSVIFEFIKGSKNIKIEEFLYKSNTEIVKIEKGNNSIVDKFLAITAPTINDICEIFKGMAVKDRNNFLTKSPKGGKDIFLLGNCMGRYEINDKFYCNYSDLTIVGGTKKIEKHNIAPRIIIRRTGNFLCCALLNEKALTESTLYSCYPKDNKYNINYIIGLLNSKLYTYIVRQLMITNEQAFPQILMTDIEMLKIPNITLNEQKCFVVLVEIIINKLQIIKVSRNNLIEWTKERFSEIEFNRKLTDWHNLTWKEFDTELKKQNCILLPNEVKEWEQYFLREQKQINTIQEKIKTTDNEIDKMVYELYGLTKQEIDIIERGN